MVMLFFPYEQVGVKIQVNPVVTWQIRVILRRLTQQNSILLCNGADVLNFTKKNF